MNLSNLRCSLNICEIAVEPHNRSTSSNAIAIPVET